MSRRRLDQQGSLTVELVVLTPVLFLLALMVVMFGRVSESKQRVVEAATAGADAAAVLPNPGSAGIGASVDAAVEVAGGDQSCVHARISTDVSHYYPGGFVTVTVQCQVGLSDLSLPGVPGSTTVQASAVAPIDPYRSVG
jgi:Flp pilus assembly protein TadG